MSSPAPVSLHKTCFGTGAVVVLMILVAMNCFGQVAQLAHFVSPSYPPLAWTAGITGQVVLELEVDKSGSVTSVSETTPAAPVLAEWAKKSIAEWKFHPSAHNSKFGVVFYYGFSGATEETNPKTTVKVDFETGSMCVSVTIGPTAAVRH